MNLFGTSFKLNPTHFSFKTDDKLKWATFPKSPFTPGLVKTENVGPAKPENAGSTTSNAPTQIQMTIPEGTNKEILPGGNSGSELAGTNKCSIPTGAAADAENAGVSSDNLV